jgi:hypothetical protein
MNLLPGERLRSYGIRGARPHEVTTTRGARILGRMQIVSPDRLLVPTVASQLPAVADLCLKHRVRRLALFGSGANGRFDSTEGSDLDFLAEFEPMSPREHAGAYFGLMEDLDRLLGVRIDLVEASAIRNPYFKEAVRNTQVVLYEAA